MKSLCVPDSTFIPLTTLILNESKRNIRRAGQVGDSALVASLSSTAVFQCISAFIAEKTFPVCTLQQQYKILRTSGQSKRCTKRVFLFSVTSFIHLAKQIICRTAFSISPSLSILCIQNNVMNLIKISYWIYKLKIKN